MADIHVSKAGSNTAPYDTWAKAATTWASAIAGSAAGDRFLCGAATAHRVVAATDTTYAFPGTPSNPNEVISGTPGTTSGLTAVALGAKIAVSGSSPSSITGSVRFDSMNFEALSSTSVLIFATDGNVQKHISCVYTAGLALNFGGTSASAVTKVSLNDPAIFLLNTSGRVEVSGDFSISGGGFNGSAILTNPLFFSPYRSCNLEVNGFDASNLPQTQDLTYCAYGGNRMTFRDCLMPANWSGVPCSASPAANQFELWNCTSQNNTYFVHLQDAARRMTHNVSSYRTGGASDGTTPLAWNLIAGPNCSKANVARSAPILVMNTAVGAAVTAAVEIAHSLGAALTSEECWLEVEYLGEAVVNYSYTATSRTKYPTAAAAIPSSTASWVGSPTFTQKLSVSFTPQKAGFLIARVCTVVTSSTILVDPVLNLA